MPKIEIGQNTNIDQLRKFTEQLGDNAKVRAKIGQDGSITLYTSEKRDLGIREFFTGHVTRRQEGAKQAMDALVTRMMNDPNIDQGAKDLLRDIKDALPTGRGETRGAQFKQIILDAIAARDRGLEFGAKLLEGLKENDTGKLDEMKDVFSKSMSESISKLPKNEQILYSCGKGQDYLGAIALTYERILGPDNGHFGPTFDECSPEAKKLLEDSYQVAMTKLSDRILDDKHIQIDGKVYEEQKQIGEGAFGTVHLFKTEDGESLVIKKPILQEGESIEEKFDEASNEVRIHLKTLGEKGSENVIGLKGALRTPEGGLLIALETAPYGNGYHVIEGINKGLGLGLIDKDVAKTAHATLLMDMLKGMQHMHDQGLLHQDVKSPNFLVGSEGYCKLTDFGLSDDKKIVSQTERLVDNPIWLSPELLAGHAERKQVLKNLDNGLTKLDDLKQTLKDGGMSKTDIQTLMLDIEKGRQENRDFLDKEYEVEVRQSSDTWAIGVTAYQMFLGKDPMESKFLSQMEKKIIDFGSDVDDRILVGPMGKDDIVDEDVKELINGLMHPDPDQRWSPERALESPVFKGLDVGGIMIRDFLSTDLLEKVGKVGRDQEPPDDLKLSLENHARKVT